MSDIPGQASIPTPKEEPLPLMRCESCTKRATTMLELEKPRYRHVKKGGKQVKVLAKRALEVPVCAEHFRSLKRSDAA